MVFYSLGCDFFVPHLVEKENFPEWRNAYYSLVTHDVSMITLNELFFFGFGFNFFIVMSNKLRYFKSFGINLINIMLITSG